MDNSPIRREVEKALNWYGVRWEEVGNFLYLVQDHGHRYLMEAIPGYVQVASRDVTEEKYKARIVPAYNGEAVLALLASGGIYIGFHSRMFRSWLMPLSSKIPFWFVGRFVCWRLFGTPLFASYNKLKVPES